VVHEPIDRRRGRADQSQLQVRDGFDAAQLILAAVD
jgi:hypothetical protein